MTPHKSPDVKILFTNADQLTTSKMIELEHRISTEKPTFIAVSEVKHKHTNKERDMNEYNINGFTLYHCNLDKNNGRGIAVYVLNSVVKSVIQIDIGIDFAEYCLLQIKLRGNDKMLFGCIYRSPTPSEMSTTNNENLNKLLRSICARTYSHLCIVGDFNFSKINWSSMSTREPGNSIDSKFFETIYDCFLHQHVNQPTRVRGRNEPSLLDLILTNEEFQVSDIKHVSPLGASDHNVIAFKFNCYIDTVPNSTKYLYHKADFEAMKNSLSESNWCEHYMASVNEKSVEDAWDLIKSKFMELRAKYVPVQAGGLAPWTKKGEIPVDETIRSNIHKKHQLHRRWINAQHGNKEELRLQYTRARNKVKTLLRKAKRNFERDISNNAKSSPKKFWSYVRRKMKTRAGIAPLLQNPDDKNSLKFSDLEKASILQDQFCSVFVQEPDGDIPTTSQVACEIMPEITITEEKVKEEIKSVNKNKSCGPDEIDIRMLQELLNYMSKPITALLIKSYSSGVIPKDWLSAVITAIFKKGSSNKAENYRPISLTSIVCKIMESIIKKEIVNHCRTHKLFADEQHGFISGRSTTTQLLKFIDDCLQSYVKGGVIDTIYLDFAKAFYTVPHRRLIEKLRSNGISGATLTWIEAFLENRSQVV